VLPGGADMDMTRNGLPEAHGGASSACVGLALLVSMTLLGCSGPPPPSPSLLASSRVARPPLAPPLAPPPSLQRFGSFAEDEEVQLFPLEGAPLLRVGARLYSLRDDQATREPGLEKALFDDAGKPWFTRLAGSHPGNLYADRKVPGGGRPLGPDTPMQSTVSDTSGWRSPARPMSAQASSTARSSSPAVDSIPRRALGNVASDPIARRRGGPAGSVLPVR